MKEQDRRIDEPERSGQWLAAVSEQGGDERAAASHADEITLGPGVFLQGIDGTGDTEGACVSFGVFGLHKLDRSVQAQSLQRLHPPPRPRS